MGPDPQGRSYGSYASFRDPDGNKWLLQEITERLPGRVEPTGVATLAPLLHETAEHHDRFEKTASPHDWWDWYAAYLSARERGSRPHEADASADLYMAEVKGVVADGVNPHRDRPEPRRPGAGASDLPRRARDEPQRLRLER